MALSSEEISDILALWRDTDILAPFVMKDLEDAVGNTDTDGKDLVTGTCKWTEKNRSEEAKFVKMLESVRLEPVESKTIRLFIVYFGIFTEKEYFERITELLWQLKNGAGTPLPPSMRPRSSESGEICLATVMVNHFGKIIPKTFHASRAFEWIIEKAYDLEKNENPDAEPPSNVRDLFQRFARSRLNHDESAAAPLLPAGTQELYNIAWKKSSAGKGYVLTDLAPDELCVTADFVSEWNRTVCSLFGGTGKRGVWVSERVQKHTRRLSDDFLNPFYADYLGRMSDGVRERGNPEKSLSPALLHLFNRAFAGGEKKDILRSPQEFCRLADPAFSSLGRWPEDTGRSLVCAQQVALGQMLTADDAKPLVAVNGPPGTGKTTLLRELVAHVVVKRAEKIAELADPADESVFLPVGDEGSVLSGALTEDSAIVVASNTNNGVENITREFPYQYTYEGRAERFDYFGAVVTALESSERYNAWGFVSVPFGKKLNLDRVCRTLFEFDRTRGESTGELAKILEAEAKRFGSEEALRDAFRDAAWRFRLCRHDLEGWMGAESAAYDLDRETNGLGEADPFAASNASMIKPFGKMDFTDPARHLDTLYENESVAHVKTELFLIALELHKLFILIQRKRFADALQFSLGKLMDFNNDPALISLCLGTFAFLCPVISTTLASSVCRFADFAAKSVPWVFIDESSQVLPYAAVMMLQKAKRAIVVGDPQQLGPVLKVPDTVIRLLVDGRSHVEPWAPLGRCSLQKLADGAQSVGAWIGAGKDAVWTGLPLRAHRRCYPPMFNICNAVSYQNQMVLDAAHADAQARKRFLPSFWLNVTPSVPSERNVVAEEISALKDVLVWADGALAMQNMAGRITEAKSVMICSPFVPCRTPMLNVKQKLSQKLRFLDIGECGTVHALQGRQADIVILVLGSKSGKNGHQTRRWAAAEPNLINVAVSRAVETLVVIGCAADWQCFETMKRIAAELGRFGGGTVESLSDLPAKKEAGLF